MLRILAEACCQHQHTLESQRAETEAKEQILKVGQSFYQLPICLAHRREEDRTDLQPPQGDDGLSLYLQNLNKMKLDLQPVFSHELGDTGNVFSSTCWQQMHI